MVSLFKNLKSVMVCEFSRSYVHGIFSVGTQAGGVEAYDDAGEALTISDSLGETWIFHVAGGAKNITKSVWAARRVPKGEIAVISNNFIIGDLPLEPTDDILFNPKIREATKAKGEQ